MGKNKREGGEVFYFLGFFCIFFRFVVLLVYSRKKEPDKNMGKSMRDGSGRDFV